MKINVFPKRKERKHHDIIKEATEFYVNKLIGKRAAKKINLITIKLATSIDYGTLRGVCREIIHKDGSMDILIKLDVTDTFPQIISTLAHEMIHAKQSVTEELVIEGDIWKWKGKKMKYKDSWYNDYTKEQQCARLPWESEAYSKESALARSFFTHYFKIEESGNK